MTLDSLKTKASNMPKKLAITVAGAVSLGSYEAGVLYEIIRAIGEHNTAPKTTDENRIEIDILTGASAGGMTAVIAAQKLLFEAPSLDQPYNNSFYRPWVKDVDLKGLLALQKGEDPTHSIFSSNLVEDISKRHITLRYEGGLTPVRRKHEASAAKIRLGVAVSNLNGVDWEIPVLPKDEFIYTCYQDQVKRETPLDSGNPADDTMDVWEFFRNAAVASGAFPFAFRTKNMVRHQSEFNNVLGCSIDGPIPDGPKPNLAPFASDPRQFTYTDGGVFQNEPLGMAKDLVDLEDPTHTGTESRFYLFVAPGSKGSSSSSQFSEKIANLGATATTLVGAIYNQARFHDWIQAEGVNQKINLFNTRATQLQKALINGSINYLSLHDGAQTLLNSLIPNAATRGVEWDRVKKQWQQEFDALATARGDAAAKTWIDSILAFETAADLGDKDEMRVYGITASEEELAGANVEAFIGFFDQRYRDHDYDTGREKARMFIEKLNAFRDADGNPDPLAPINYAPPNPDDLHEIDHDLDGLKLQDVSSDLRKQVKSRLTERAHDLLAEIGVPFAGREAIDLFFITPQLNKLLGL